MDFRTSEKFEMNYIYHAITDETARSADTKTQLLPRELPVYRWKTWKNFAIFVGIFLLFSVCMAEQILVLIYWIVDSGYSSGLSSDLCLMDDSLSIAGIWGSYEFKTVKIIDAVNNLVLGRGVQVLCGWISYRVVGMATLRIMQEHTVPLSYLYSNTFDGYSAKAVLAQYRTLFYLKSWRARVIVVWLGLSIVFLILSPTMIDLTTGYISSRKPFINLPDSSNSTDNFGSSNLIEFPISCAHNLANTYNNKTKGWPCWETYYNNYIPCISNCTIGGHVFTIDDVTTSDGRWRVNNTKKIPGNLLVCNNQDDYYYGVSFGYLTLFSLALTLWLCGMFGLWIDTIRFGHLWKMGRGWGPWRVILDIGDHLRASLGDDHSGYCEPELEKHIERLDLVGHEVRTDGEYACVKLSSNPGGHTSLTTPGLVFGSESRLNQRRAMTT